MLRRRNDKNNLVKIYLSLSIRCNINPGTLSVSIKIKQRHQMCY